MSRRTALAEFKNRLSAILIANGYHTDAGAEIADSEVYELGPDDPPVSLAMVVKKEVLIQHQADVKLALHLPVEVVILVRPNLDDVRGSIEDAIEDVKRAMETGDRQFDGLLVNTLRRGEIEPLDRTTGSNVAGAIIPYTLPISEAYGGA